MIVLSDFIQSLTLDHSDLDARLRTVTVSAKSTNASVTLHAHYLAFRAGKPTVEEFVDVITFKLVPFCLHRRHIADTQAKWPSMAPDKVQASAARLQQQAIDLFKKAQKNTNRNGEFGELVLYLLVEKVLGAPQLVAKMSLKTNTEMPVHGSDGIHVRYDLLTDSLFLIWGESKCHASVGGAIRSAVESIQESLQYEKMGRELFLIDQYMDLSGVPLELQGALKGFLDPYNEKYNQRYDGSVALIVFDFDEFAELNKLTPADVETTFRLKLEQQLEINAKILDSAIGAGPLAGHAMEFFFIPVPSIAEFRAKFQNHIGWS
ncbi:MULTISPECIES: DUF1837 domain-containing protein [unclassified Mesorhizobium]|uniref:HamA C-terminal domain-containing protein n=1 Tax=unclassified Mesorhizobium TaxID=325217 RepID=UPI00333801FB